MKKTFKYIIGAFALILGLGILSSCTASFCSPMDLSRIYYVLDKGTTIYSDENTLTYNGKELTSNEVLDLNEFGLTSVEQPIYVFHTFDYSVLLRDTVVSTAMNESSYYYEVPSLSGFFAEFDKRVLAKTIDVATKNLGVDLSTITSAGDPSSTAGVGESIDTLNEFLKSYGFIKFLDDADYSSENENGHSTMINFSNIINEMRIESAKGELYTKVLTDDSEVISYTIVNDVPGNDFYSLYVTSLSNLSSQYRSCITTIESDQYKLFGMYTNGEGATEQIQITEKDWGYAWSKGFLEGLLIYPIAVLCDSLTMYFVGGDTALLVNGDGWVQFGAILIVTLIVRLILFLITLPSTLSQAKMQSLQPELAKIQAKYSNSDTNDYEKQRLAQESQALYKKYKIRPFMSIVAMIIQFPIFICVWGALSASSPLSTGNFYNMNLTSTIWSVLTNFNGLPSNQNGWWTAFVVIIIMIITQVAAILVPNIIRKRQNKTSATKMGVNKAQDKTSKTMKYVQYGMLALIVVMGFTLPSGMSVYWIAGGIIGVIQSIATIYIGNYMIKKEKYKSKPKNLKVKKKGSK